MIKNVTLQILKKASAFKTHPVLMICLQYYVTFLDKFPRILS